MGKLWFGKAAEVVVEADFNGFVVAKAVGFSRGQFYFVVEALDGPRRQSPFRSEPVEK